MYVAGEAPRRAQRLIEVTYECLLRGIAAVKPGATTGDIGYAIQTYAESERCSVVRDFCGHGLGRLFHDEPNILHVGRRGEGAPLKPGMFFTIEPMINLGGAGGESAVRRLDRGDARPLALRAVRAHGRRDRDRRRNLHLLARRARASALSPTMSERPGGDEPPIITAIASGCASVCARPAPRRSPTTSCIELVLFRAIPRRDVKPLAKALIARFGSFAEAIAAPPAAARRGRGHERRASIAEFKIVEAERQALRQGRRQASACRSARGARSSTIAAPRWRSRTARNSASCSSTRRTA